MAPYVFCVDRIEVHNCKSKGQHTDTDWLHITVAIDEQTPVDTNTRIHGSISAGQSFDGPFVAGPYEISDSSRVGVSFLIENKSHTDAAKQQSEVIAVGTAIVAGMFGAWSAAASVDKLDVLSVASAVAAGVTAAAGAAWAFLVGDSNPDCNGEVLTRVLIFERGELAERGTHFIDDDERVGPSKEDCGNPPVTKVKYSVRVWTLKQALVTKGFDINHPIGLRPIMTNPLAPVTSVRTFMGLRA